MAIEVAPDFWRLELPMPNFMSSVVVYLVADGDGYVLIDAGMSWSQSWAALERQLAELRAPITAIHTVVTTHTHPDHFGAAAWLRERTGARIWLHRGELPIVHHLYEDRSGFEPVLSAWLRRYGGSEEEAGSIVGSVGRLNTSRRRVTPDRLLAEGDELAIGQYRLAVVWTPGHTPGHICLYEPRRRWLLTGDHVLPRIHPNVSMYPYSIVNPMAEYLRSLSETAELDVELALPGHGEPFVHLAERVRAVHAHQLARRARLVELLAPRPKTAFELASELWTGDGQKDWAQFPPILRNTGVGTLIAHLELLAEDGLAARHEDDVVRFSRPC